MSPKDEYSIRPSQWQGNIKQQSQQQSAPTPSKNTIERKKRVKKKKHKKNKSKQSSQLASVLEHNHENEQLTNNDESSLMMNNMMYQQNTAPYGMLGGNMLGGYGMQPNQFIYTIQSIIYTIHQSIQMIQMNHISISQCITTIMDVFDSMVTTFQDVRASTKKNNKRLQFIRWMMVSSVSYLVYKIIRRLILSRRRRRIGGIGASMMSMMSGQYAPNPYHHNYGGGGAYGNPMSGMMSPYGSSAYGGYPQYGSYPGSSYY